MSRCSVCYNTKSLKQCCEGKRYCSSDCQNADKERHGVTCLVGSRKSTETMFTQEELNTIREFELLLDAAAPEFLEYKRDDSTMRLVYFILDSGIVKILSRIPTENNLRAVLLAPLLRPQPDNSYIVRIIQSYGFGENFLALLTYSESMRPLVAMQKFWEIYGLEQNFVEEASKDLYSPKNDPDASYVVREKAGFYTDRSWVIPSIRYQSGMSGAYTGGSASGFLGTFSYYQPGSAALIVADKVLVAGSKISAMRHLGVPFETVYALLTKHDWSQNSLNPWPCYNSHRVPIPGGGGKLCLARHFGFVTQADLANFTKIPNTESYDERSKAAISVLWKKVLNYYYDSDVIELDSMALAASMYTIEDALDQALAKAALNYGAEVVILTNMAGQTRQVTEILDVRERQEMFKSMLIKH